MKKSSCSFLVLLLLLCQFFTATAQTKSDADRPLAVEQLGTKFSLQNNHMGKEFFVTFHPIWDLYDIEYRIYVTSYVNTSVTIELPGETNKITKDVKAYEPTMFSSKNGDISITWMGTESELVTNNGLKISSLDPISVYVYIPSRDYAGEGYQALPSSSLGKEYFNFSYYDFFYTGNSRYHPGGFTIVSTEDMTDVTINLNGRIKGAAHTKGGKDIGDVIKVKLNKGQTYMVMGDATTKGGLFDLTGSRITANKPIAVVSFHQFTCITSFIANFGNWLSEMLVPTNAWGDEYVTVNFTRNGAKGQLGDFFRVIGSEDNTTWSCKYYDKTSGKFLGSQSSNLKTAGDFFEYNQDGTSQPSIRGVSVWRSDKPIMVMQYAYSHQWDDDIIQSPVMVTLNSLKQYTSPILFTVVGSFPIQLTLMIDGDKLDKSFRLLNTVNLDGVQLVSKYPAITYNQIPSTNIYWVKVTVESGVHTVSGETGIAGYLHHPRPSSLGMYIGMNLNFVSENDNLAPRTSVIGDCGKFTMTVLENTNVDSTQVDQGISKIVMISEDSYNFSMTLNEPDKFKPQFKITSQKVYLNVIDIYQYARAIIYSSDRAGNYHYDTLLYEPEKIVFDPPALDFCKTKLNCKTTQKVKITNAGNFDIMLSSKHLPVSPELMISAQFPDTLKAGCSFEFDIEFTPTGSTLNLRDSLSLSARCTKFSMLIKGDVVAPKINVTNYQFQETRVGQETCAMEGTGPKIWCQGTDTLIIYSIEEPEDPFSYLAAAPSLPLLIAPGGIYNFPELCFEPTDSIYYENKMLIKTNVDTIGSELVISGRGEIIVSVNEESQQELSISPNPATDYIEISYPQLMRGPVGVTPRIFDILGVEVLNNSQLSIFNSQLRIYVSGLSPGLYFVKVGDKVKKFIKY